MRIRPGDISRIENNHDRRFTSTVGLYIISTSHAGCVFSKSLYGSCRLYAAPPEFGIFSIVSKPFLDLVNVAMFMPSSQWQVLLPHQAGAYGVIQTNIGSGRITKDYSLLPCSIQSFLAKCLRSSPLFIKSHPYPHYYLSLYNINTPFVGEMSSLPGTHNTIKPLLW